MLKPSAPTLPSPRGGGKRRWRNWSDAVCLGWNLNGPRRPAEGQAAISPDPEINERHDPDNRDHDVAGDAPKNVKARVHEGDGSVGDEDAPDHPHATVPGRIEDDPTESCRPST